MFSETHKHFVCNLVEGWGVGGKAQKIFLSQSASFCFASVFEFSFALILPYWLTGLKTSSYLLSVTDFSNVIFYRQPLCSSETALIMAKFSSVQAKTLSTCSGNPIIIFFSTSSRRNHSHPPLPRFPNCCFWPKQFQCWSVWRWASSVVLVFLCVSFLCVCVCCCFSPPLFFSLFFLRQSVKCFLFLRISPSSLTTCLL